MPTYRNDGKNVLIVKNTEGVVIPVSPGESVKTFDAITVAGFTQTSEAPTAWLSGDGKQLIISVLITAKPDGSTDPRQVTEEDAGFEYWTGGFYLSEAYVESPASNFPTNNWDDIAVQDEKKVRVWDPGWLTLPAAANDVRYMTNQTPRMITSKLTIAAMNTGHASSSFKLNLKLKK